MFRGVLVTFPPERRGGKIVPVIIEGVPEKYGRFEIDNSPTAYRTMEHFDHDMSSRYERVVSCFGLDLESKTPDIEKVIFNDPATIVIWKDKTKTVVKCQEGDTYSPELGLAMCIAKKYLGNKGNFNEVFKKWLPEKPLKTRIPKVGTKIKIVSTRAGCHGAIGKVGIVTENYAPNGLLSDYPGYNVAIENYGVWRINPDAKIEILE